VGSVSNYDHPNFLHDQYVTEQIARHEAAAKITAAALSTTPQERAATEAATRKIVGLYLAALRTSRPDRDAEATQLAKTPWHGGAYYVSTVARGKNTRVRPKVKKAKTARSPKLGAQSTPTDQQGQQEALEATASLLSTVEGDNKLAGLKKNAMRRRLENAFENLKAKAEGADREFNDVAYKFLLGKVSNRMYDAGECAVTEHDVTNHILFEVFQNLYKVRNIYSHLCNAAWKQGGKAFTRNIEDRKMHQPLMVEVEDEQGKTDKVDNPGIRGNVEYKRGGKVVFQEERPQFRRDLPAFIQGKDLEICNGIRANHSYAEIAENTGMTVPAIKSRVAQMKRRYLETKSAN
jgi:hypothetical protein